MAEGDNVNTLTTMVTHEEDRLSSLPDTLLLEILSLLPFASAAATSALSRRWVSLWTQLPHIIINDDSFRYSDDFNKFSTVVYKILNQMTSPKIKTFKLHFHCSDSEIEFNVCSSVLNSWVTLICARNPVHFEVRFLTYSWELFPLPTCIFETKSLEELDLMGFFLCKLPDSGNISLSNLKKLKFCCVHFDSRLLRTLFRSCPLLETLLMRLEFEEDEFVEISAPILKSLTIWMLGSSLGSKFVIDTPLLESIEVQNWIASYNFVNYPCNLGSARIHIEDHIFELGNTYITHIKDLVRGVSNTKSLQLDNNVAVFNTLNQMNPDIWSLFRNLTHLRLCVYEEHVNWGAAIPLRLLSKLNEIHLTGIKGDENDISSVQFILDNASLLKCLSIGCFDPSGNRGKPHLWKEYKFCSHLFMLSKSSQTCEIVFEGEYIHASSYGSLVQGTSQVNWRSPHICWPYILGDVEE